MWELVRRSYQTINNVNSSLIYFLYYKNLIVSQSSVSQLQF